MAILCNIVVFTSNGVWHKPEHCRAIELVIRGGGGGGACGMVHTTTNQRWPGPGGGGGAVVITPRFNTRDLPAEIPVIVGTGGFGAAEIPSTLISGQWYAGGDGSASSFGDIASAPGGYGGGEPGWDFDLGGPGGISFIRGGNGGAGGADGQSTSGGDIRIQAGGGGGGSGAGYTGSSTLRGPGEGGWSGLVAPNTTMPPYWKTLNTGSGGRGGSSSAAATPGGFPAGGGGGGNRGGGAGAPGAAGSVTVIEYIEGPATE